MAQSPRPGMSGPGDDEVTARYTGDDEATVQVPQMPPRTPPQPPPAGAGWQQGPPNPPPAGYQGWGWAPVPQRRSTTKWWVLGVTCVVAVVAVVAALVLTSRTDSAPIAEDTPTSTAAPSATAAPHPTQSNVDVARVDSLLPSDAELITLVGAAQDSKMSGTSDMYSGAYTGVECAGLFYPTLREVYQGSGWTASRSKSLRDPPTGNVSMNHIATVGVTVYPTPEMATSFFTKSAASWRSCAGRTINSRNPGDPDDKDSFWTVGQPADVDDHTLSVVQFQEGGNGWTCHAGIRVRSNVVIDVENCGKAGENPIGLIDAVTAKIGS